MDLVRWCRGTLKPADVRNKLGVLLAALGTIAIIVGESSSEYSPYDVYIVHDPVLIFALDDESCVTHDLACRVFIVTNG